MRENFSNDSIWDLSPLMSDDESFFRAIKELEAEIDNLKSFEGKLNCKENIVAFFKEENMREI